MYVSAIRLKDIRGFRTLNLKITETRRERGRSVDRPRKLTVVIGANGTCKTTLLRCIAIGLSDRSWADALVAERNGDYVRESAPKGVIEIELMTPDDEPKRFTRRFVVTKSGAVEKVELDKDTVPTDSIPFVCGYGAGRGFAVPEAGQEYRLIDAVYTLFRYDTGLNLPELILRRLHDHVGTERYDRIMRGIKKALGLSVRDTIEFTKGGGVLVSGPSVGATIPLDAWADGYRLTFNWIIDVYGWAMQTDSVTKQGGIRGIVLVDELEQHLHPSMQTQLLPKLARLWPEAQVFTTTHSPLVALGAAPDELVVLKRRGRNVVAHQSVRDFHAYSVEDMLSDPKLFDSDTYKPEVTKKLKRYRKLASKSQSSRSTKEQRDMKKLASELAAQQIPEVRENPVLNELQKILKKHNL